MPEILHTILINPIIQILEFTFFVSQYLFKERGISIIFIGIIISILCLPLYAVAEKWQQTQRETEKKLNPKIKKIKNVFKGDEQYLILSAYYRQNSYHPLYALRSSFGLLIQIPFFIAAYSYLSDFELLQNTSFLFIPDLGSPDSSLSVGKYTFNILPILMTLINIFAGAIYTKGLLIKEKFQIYGVAVIFLILLYNSPSALVLYWTINNIFSLVKNIYYQIKLKYKNYVLFILFSLIILGFSLLFITKYGHSYKGQKLFYVFLLLAFVPWIFILIKRYIHKLINIHIKSGEALVFFILSIILLFVLFGLFLPSQLIASSPQEFSFIDNYTNPLYFIFYTMLQFFGFFIVLPVCIYFLFNDNFKKYFSLFFLFLSFCILLNVFIFPGKYGLISINFIYDNNTSHKTFEILINLLTNALIILIITILFVFKKRIFFKYIISLCIFSLTAISCINIYKINNAYNELKSYYVKQINTTDDVSPLFRLSKSGKNVVILMIDRAVSVFFPFIAEETPELNEIFSGFTYYPNTVSFDGYTSMAAPPLFGGYEYTPEEINKRDDEKIIDKLNQSILLLPYIFSKNNFYVTVTDPTYANLNWISDLSIYEDYKNVKAYNTKEKYTDIWLYENDLKLQKTGETIKRNMFWYAIHKGVPLLFRDLIYIKGNWCSPILNNSLRLTLNSYSVLDYLPRLTEITNESINTALIMTNDTTHENSFLQAPEYRPVKNVTDYGKSRFAKEWSYHVNAGALLRIAEWIQFLKNENVYDNTRIIIVSDHGPEPNYMIKLGLPFNVEQFNPLLLVKDFNETGNLKTDMAFMSNADVPYLSLSGIVENPVNPFTGNKISMDRKNEPLYISITGSFNISSKNDTQYNLNQSEDFYVHKNIFSAENWIKASKFNEK